MDLAGLKAVITGGASGLGKACAQMMATKGAKVFVADKNEEAGHSVAAASSNIAFVLTDVTSEEQVNALLDRVETDGEPARVLLNCAGIAPALALSRNGVLHCLDAFDFVMKTNVTSTFLTTSRFAWRLRNADPIGEEVGVIINASSIAAIEGQAGRVAYAASKGAIAAMTLPLARELARSRIRAVAIAPGPFDTKMMDHILSRLRVELGTQAPHPSRLGKPQEYAALACHIVENPMINGEVIRIDGALRVTPW